MVYVLVDIDETMISVPGGINAKASSIMFKKVFGVEAHEEMINNVGKTEMGIIHEVLAKIGKPIDVVPVEAYKVWGEVTYDELQKKPVLILPGMTDFLNALSVDPQIKLTLLTGNSPWRAMAKLKSANFDKFFVDEKTKLLLGVFGDATPKRDELFDLIKKGVLPEDKFVVVDDSLIGALMAKENNLVDIAVTTGKATYEELKSLTPYVFKDFGEDRYKEAIEIIRTL